MSAPPLPTVENELREVEQVWARTQEVRKVVAVARQHLDNGDLADASEALEAAARLDPLGDEVARLQTAIEEGLGAQEHARQTAEALRGYMKTQLERVRRTLTGERPEEALRTLRRLEEEGFENEEVARLIATAETEVSVARARRESPQRLSPLPPEPADGAETKTRDNHAPAVGTPE